MAEVISGDTIVHIPNRMPITYAAGQLGIERDCHSQGICGKCVREVKEGAENIIPEAPLHTEADVLRKLNAPEGARLMCRTKVVSGTVVIAPVEQQCVFADLCRPKLPTNAEAHEVEALQTA